MLCLKCGVSLPLRYVVTMAITPFLSLLPLLSTVVIVSMFAAHAFAQPISPRIGDVIDSDERSYFGLFRSIVDFTSARTVTRPDGSVEFQIRQRWNESDTSVVISAESARELQRYIDEYEDLVRVDGRLDLRLLAGIVRPGLILTGAVPIEATTRDGRHYEGHLYSATDSTVVIWTGDTVYNWREVEERAVVLHYSSIEDLRQNGNRWWWVVGGVAGALATEIVRPSSRQPWINSGIIAMVPLAFGVGLGESTIIDLPIGGNPELFAGISGTLKSRAEFAASLAPELERHIAMKSQQVAAVAHEAPLPAEEILSAQPRSHFHLAVDRIWPTYLSSDTNVIYDLSMYSPSASKRATPRFAMYEWSFGFEYAPWRQFRLGVIYRPYRALEAARKRVDDDVYGNSMGIVARYVVLPVDPLFRSRWEISAEAGWTYSEMSVIGSQSNSRAPGGRDTLYRSEHILRGGFGGARVSYYALRNLSTHVAADVQLMPSFDVAKPEEVRSSNEYVRQHTIRPSYYTIRMGLQVHL